MNSRIGWVAAILGGLALWTLSNLTQGTQEPWDSLGYWTIWLPLAFLLVFLLGALLPERPWRWSVGLMFAQLPVMAIATGEIGAFVVLGMGLIAMQSLFGAVAAWLGAGLRLLVEHKLRA